MPLLVIYFLFVIVTSLFLKVILEPYFDVCFELLLFYLVPSSGCLELLLHFWLYLYLLKSLNWFFGCFYH